MSGPEENKSAAAAAVNQAARVLGDLFLLLSRLLALVVLAIYFPALMAAALLILFTSSGPAFVTKAYRRRDGSVVHLYEFRTECWYTYRETQVGALLRAADLVRLPRLANVLRGEIGAGERVERVSA